MDNVNATVEASDRGERFNLPSSRKGFSLSKYSDGIIRLAAPGDKLPREMRQAGRVNVTVNGRGEILLYPTPFGKYEVRESGRRRRATIRFRVKAPGHLVTLSNVAAGILEVVVLPRGSMLIRRRAAPAPDLGARPDRPFKFREASALSAPERENAAAAMRMRLSDLRAEINQLVGAVEGARLAVREDGALAVFLVAEREL